MENAQTDICNFRHVRGNTPAALQGGRCLPQFKMWHPSFCDCYMPTIGMSCCCRYLDPLIGAWSRSSPPRQNRSAATDTLDFSK
jgi:hypothetical protein